MKEKRYKPLIIRIHNMIKLRLINGNQLSVDDVRKALIEIGGFIV